MSKLRIYLASGWFSEDTRDILSNLETTLSAREDVELYSPRRDGIMLPPNQKHDTALRESIFNENISHIKDSDLVVANIYSGDSYNDPGTMYEIGYAMANDVPVIGFTTKMDNIDTRFKGIIDGMTSLVIGYQNLNELLDEYVDSFNIIKEAEGKKTKVLFVGNGDKDVDEKLVSCIMDSGVSIRWVNEIHDEIYNNIDKIFKDIDYVITVVDDRKTLVSWMIGQAYARGIPIVTYSNYNYGINVMLLISIVTHIRGLEELGRFLHYVNRYGIESVPKFDVSQLDSM